MRGSLKAFGDQPPHSLGLWGDGDEVAAIQDVDRRFKVRLDYRDAGDWRTVGDVFAALQRAAPFSGNDADTWRQFVEAIAAETGVDPGAVTPDTLLLGSRALRRRDHLLIAAGAAAIFGLILWLQP